jgi:DNA polymerase III subunit alpha
VSYVLGITDADPIEHDLLFERFLNPARRQMPDIDVDFDSARRDEVIDFIYERFGTSMSRWSRPSTR